MIHPSLVRVLAALLAFLLGALLGRLGWGKVINYLARFLVNFVIPTLVFFGILTSDFSRVLGVVLISTVNLLVVLSSVLAVYTRLVKLNVEEAGATIYASAYANYVFLPVPLMTVLYGDSTPAVIYASSSNFVIHLSAPIIAEYLKGGYVSVTQALRRLASFPPALALITSATLRLILGVPNLPWEVEVFRRFTSELNLSSFAVVGFSLASSWPVRLTKLVAHVMVWRLAISPAINLTILNFVPLSGVWLAAVLIQSVMPPATSSVIYSRLFGFKDEIPAVAIAIITPVSLGISTMVSLAIPPLTSGGST